MLQLACPWCGVRDEAEFRYRGDATLRRPAPDSGLDAFAAYVYDRDNPKDWHVEWWHHVHGCRRVLKVVRHTATHRIAAVAAADAEVSVPSPASDGPS
jgi:sarcosine oxidase subunit delta